MNLRNKILAWTAAVCLVALAVYAANPSFTDFNTSDFSTTGNKVRFNPGMTNYWTSLTGSGIATNGGTGLGNTFTNATLWNGTNSGNAFTSHGSGSSSEQFGAGANASGSFSTAVGNGSGAWSNASIAFGYNAFSIHASSTAIGANSLSTAAHQIMLGTSSETVVIPGTLQSTGAGTTTFTASGDANGLTVSNSFNGGTAITAKSTNGTVTINNGNGGIVASGNISAAGITNTGVTGATSLATDANGKIIAGSGGGAQDVTNLTLHLPPLSVNSGALARVPVAQTNSTVVWQPVSRFGLNRVESTTVNGNASSALGLNSWGEAPSIAGGVNAVAATATVPQYMNLGTPAAAYGSSNFLQCASVTIVVSSKSGSARWILGMTNTSNVRIVAGATQSSVNSQIANGETIANHSVFFKYSTNSANWFFYTRDGATTESNDTGLPASTSLVQLSYIINATNASAIQSIVALTNGVAACTNTQHLPTGPLTPSVACTTLDSVAKSCQFFNYYSETEW